MKITKILVSQPKPSSDKSPYYDIAKRHGVEIVFRPFIKVEGLSSKEFRQQKVNIPDFSAIIFTARTAIDHFFRLCEEMRINIPDTMKYFCTTESIALYLQKYIVYRKRKIFHAQTGKLEDLMPSIIKHNKENYLFAISDVHKDDTHILDDNRIKYTKAVMYRTVSNDFTSDEPFDYDMLLFFSPSGITSLLKNFPDFQQGEIAIGTYGASTAQAVRDAGLRLDMEAPTVKAPSVTAALDIFLRESGETKTKAAANKAKAEPKEATKTKTPAKNASKTKAEDKKTKADSKAKSTSKAKTNSQAEPKKPEKTKPTAKTTKTAKTSPDKK